MRGRDLVEFQATYFYASFVPRPSPFVLCILQAIKNWMVGRPGNKGTSMLSLAAGIATPGHVWPYWSQNECTVENQVSPTRAVSWKSIHIHQVIWGVSDRTHSHYPFLQPQWWQRLTARVHTTQDGIAIESPQNVPERLVNSNFSGETRIQLP